MWQKLLTFLIFISFLSSCNFRFWEPAIPSHRTLVGSISEGRSDFEFFADPTDDEKRYYWGQNFLASIPFDGYKVAVVAGHVVDPNTLQDFQNSSGGGLGIIARSSSQVTFQATLPLGQMYFEFVMFSNDSGTTPATPNSSTAKYNDSNGNYDITGIWGSSNLINVQATTSSIDLKVKDLNTTAITLAQGGSTSYYAARDYNIKLCIASTQPSTDVRIAVTSQSASCASAFPNATSSSDVYDTSNLYFRFEVADTFFDWKLAASTNTSYDYVNYSNLLIIPDGPGINPETEPSASSVVTKYCRIDPIHFTEAMRATYDGGGQALFLLLVPQTMCGPNG